MAPENFPRVLQILPVFNGSGGVERGTRDIADALLDNGSIPFIASAGGNLVPAFVEKGGVHVDLPLKSKNPFTIINNVGRLQRAVIDNEIDILHVRSRAPAWSALVVSKTLDIPLITTYHAPYNADSFLKKRYNAVMARGKHVIAISNFIAQHIHQQYGKKKWFDSQQIMVIPRGIDTHFFDPARVSAQDVEAIRKQYNLPPHARIVLLPGRLTRWKGQKILIKALAMLDKPDVYIVFVGDDQGRETYVAELQKKAHQLGLIDRTRFVPNTPHMPSFYALSTLVVSASTDPEGFGRVIAEAGAMKRPIIATNHGAAPEIVLDEKTGWLIPSADVGALRDALEKALSLPEEHLKSLGEVARQHISTHFSQEIFCQKTLHVYKTIGKRTPR